MLIKANWTWTCFYIRTYTYVLHNTWKKINACRRFVRDRFCLFAILYEFYFSRYSIRSKIPTIGVSSAFPIVELSIRISREGVILHIGDVFHPPTNLRRTTLAKTINSTLCRLCESVAKTLSANFAYKSPKRHKRPTATQRL